MVALLAVDTTTPRASVAVVSDEHRVLAVRRSQVSTHSESLLAMIAEAVAEAGIAVADLEAFACAAGPGSFTGLRIGLATVKGLCLATGRPLLLVSSLATLAARAPEGVAVMACLDALKGEVYAGAFLGGVPPTVCGPERVLAPERLLVELAAAPSLFVGDGAVRHPSLLAPGVTLLDSEPPDAIEVARLAWRRRERGEADDLASSAPRYIRASEAEMLAARRTS